MIDINNPFVLAKTNDFDYLKYFRSIPSKPVLETSQGALFDGDCLDLLYKMKDESIDTIFADPPFNIGKIYRKNTNDNLSAEDYLQWCKQWITHCDRILKPGGAIFIYNLPKWNITLGHYLNELGLEFRHWIAIEISATMPITGRLYPAHYSMLYYTKGKPKVFKKIRTPFQLCRHCKKEVKDYGGHRKAMNPNGVSLKDVWSDIPPVRHWKFKSKDRDCNSLSTKLLDRVIEMTTNEGDTVFDPFGGSGTTYSVCEHKKRNWIGCEIDYTPEIIDRLSSDKIAHHNNDDFVES